MKSADRQIIALGGGGFSMEPGNPSLDLYVLQQTSAPNPRVTFLATATGDDEGYIANFYAAFSRYECRPSHLGLFRRTPDIRAHILSQDVVYVGGGNTKSLLALWREWRLDAALREAWENGVVLAGVSAGAICWFEQGLTDSFADDLAVLECLGFLKGSCCPHYDGEPERRPAYHRLLSKNLIMPGYALDDGAAVHFVGSELKRTVVSREGAKAYGVEVRDGVVHEESLNAILFKGNDLLG